MDVYYFLAITGVIHNQKLSNQMKDNNGSWTIMAISFFMYVLPMIYSNIALIVFSSFKESFLLQYSGL